MALISVYEINSSRKMRAYFKIAHSDARKVTSFEPIAAGDHIGQDLGSPVLVLRSKESVEQEKLQNAVDDEQQLHQQVRDCYVSTNQTGRPS